MTEIKLAKLFSDGLSKIETRKCVAFFVTQQISLKTLPSSRICNRAIC